MASWMAGALGVGHVTYEAVVVRERDGILDAGAANQTIGSVTSISTKVFSATPMQRGRTTRPGHITTATTGALISNFGEPGSAGGERFLQG